MNVLIFEDNENDFKVLNNCINNLFKKENIAYHLHRCKDITDLYKRIFLCDILFLDIEIGNDNGIKIGEKIRNENCNCRIIIVSNHSKYLIDGYKIQADRYLLKPLQQSIFDIEMKNVLWRHFRMNYGFVDTKISPKRILFKDILYIETLDHKTRIHFTNNNSIDTTYPLSYWKAKVPTNLFGQPYRCYFVNFLYIYNYDEKEITLTNNEKIPISRFYKSSFQESYFSSIQFLI